MKEEKKFLIPEAIIVLFTGELDILTGSGGDLGGDIDPDDPSTPGY